MMKATIVRQGDVLLVPGTAVPEAATVANKPGQRKLTFKPGSAYYTLVLPKLLADVPEIVDGLRAYAVTADGDLRPFLLRTATSFENLVEELARIEAARGKP